MSRRLPALLGFATAAALAATQAPVGFTRDEGFYFSAAAAEEAWLRLLLHAPAEAWARTEPYWSVNFEHPGLAKLAFAVSHALFGGVLGDALSWRLPAFVFAGLLSFWLSRLGGARSPAAAVLAPLLFWCAERTFFHGHLASFDVPICALWAGVGVAWARALGLLDGEPSATALRGRRLWFAFVAGCALAVKHNAWFLPPVLLVHALFCPPAVRRRALITLPFLALSPLVLFAAWPLLWHAPLAHLRDWSSFHLHHVHYAWEYLGHELRHPPFPVEYPLVVDALALPLPTVALLSAAALRLLWLFLRRRFDWSRPGGIDPLQLLELGLAVAALLPFLLRTTPIFGGLKHWLAFPALLCPEAAGLLVWAARRSGLPRALPLGAAAVLLPGLWQIAHVHPFGTSAYGELVGGIPGAASLGMQRQYWSGNVAGVLPWLNANCPPRARIFFHEVTPESFAAYQREGLLRSDLAFAPSLAASDYAALQWHREFRWFETDAQNLYGTHAPAAGLWIDEVPQILVYARPGLPGAR